MAETVVVKYGNNFNDLTGKKFGRLTAVKPAHRGKGGWWWFFRCDCGESKIVRGAYATSGMTRSCGCLKLETTSRVGKAAATHGESRCSSNPTPEYVAWEAMWQRVRGKRKDYGGRGIKVCDRWKKYENFLDDMGRRPSPDHSLDRRDVNGDYEPDNCRWATRSEQQHNKRNNVLITLNGKTMSPTHWASETGISRSTIYNRLRQGKSPEQVLSTENLLRSEPS